MKKQTHLFTGLVVVFIIGLLASGYAGQKYVRDQIRTEAAKAVRNQEAADRYTLNHTACAIKKIVAPQLASLKKARNDMTLSKSARARADVTYTKTSRLLLIWTTIPPDFDCSTLPKKPPLLTHT